MTEPKTALAGVMLEISFARFRVSMATLNVERMPFRPLSRWELVAIVEIVVAARKLYGERAVTLRKCPRTMMM
jgi:hypothetical protein